MYFIRFGWASARTSSLAIQSLKKMFQFDGALFLGISPLPLHFVQQRISRELDMVNGGDEGDEDIVVAYSSLACLIATEDLGSPLFGLPFSRDFGRAKHLGFPACACTQLNVAR
jgi:hypothetical protein